MVAVKFGVDCVVACGVMCVCVLHDFAFGCGCLFAVLRWCGYFYCYVLVSDGGLGGCL